MTQVKLTILIPTPRGPAFSSYMTQDAEPFTPTNEVIIEITHVAAAHVFSGNDKPPTIAIVSKYKYLANTSKATCAILIKLDLEKVANIQRTLHASV